MSRLNGDRSRYNRIRKYKTRMKLKRRALKAAATATAPAKA